MYIWWESTPSDNYKNIPRGHPGGIWADLKDTKAGEDGTLREERRKARYLALRCLYQWEITGETLEEVIASVKQELEEGGQWDPFTEELLNIIRREQPRIDGLIERYADRWSLKRMPIIDRNLLRMGMAEILYMEDIPPGVTVNECVELAKRYSTEDSGKFVNGLLGHFIRDHQLSGKDEKSNG